MRYLSEGSYATSSTKIAKLIKISPLKIEFSIPEKYASEIKIGYPITFSSDGNNKILMHQFMQSILKLILTQEPLFFGLYIQTRMKNLNPEDMHVLHCVLSRIDNAVAIPTEALIPEMEGEKVFIYKTWKSINL